MFFIISSHPPLSLALCAQLDNAWMALEFIVQVKSTVLTLKDGAVLYLFFGR